MGPTSDGGNPDIPASWQVIGEEEVLKDEAVRSGLDELEGSLREIGLAITSPPDDPGDAGKFVLRIEDIPVDVPDGRTPQETELTRDSAYEIAADPGPPRSGLIRAQSPLGLTYALFALADAVQVEGKVPDKKEKVRPFLPYRFAYSGGPIEQSLSGPEVSDEVLAASREVFEENLRKVLKCGYNFVVVSGTENYVPWKDPTYGARSEKYRKYLAEYIEAAHAHHLKIMLMGDEFTYLPALLERFQIKPSVKEPGLWEALKDKYRGIIEACPELDGVATRIGEHIPHYDFQTLDLIHSRESEPDPRIEERYRQFIKTMHGVAVGEYGKYYLNRTWVVNVHEQHSVPQVFEATFTPEVPADNLIFSIKLTTADQWYHGEPYNPTYGTTHHTTVAEGELYSGYQGRGTYIDYPARYFQAALEWATDRGTKGVSNGVVASRRGYGTGLTSDAILYVYSHLAWNPRGSADRLTEDWAAATFGREVKKEIAEIFLLGAVAIRDGLYIRQPSLRNWDPIRHLRCDTFVLKGNPEWDNGKGHVQFLKELYLECKPWLDQTISELDSGVSVGRRMLSIYGGCRDRIADEEKAVELGGLLEHGLASLQLNRAYVGSFLRYFRYREEPSPENRSFLEQELDGVDENLDSYCGKYDLYNVRAITLLRDLGRQALEDIQGAERLLEESPTSTEIDEMFARAEEESAKLLEKNPDAILVATWKGTMDGRDLLRIKDGAATIEHISDDSVISPLLTPHNDIPKDRPCRIVIKPLDIRGAAYVKEQPTQQNDYTVTIFLQDLVPGKYVFQIEIYAICDDGQ
jgi:hypothetical protein